MLVLALIGLLAGTLIGAIGIGGILLIPALAAVAHVEIHRAMATALFTFIFTGIAGTLLFQRKGTIEWRITAPLCAGALVFAFVGAWVNSLAPSHGLALLLGAIIVFAGVHGLAGRRRRGVVAFHDDRGAQRVLLVALGAVAGFGSGLTGVGGPALSVPLMMLFGFTPLPTIGASQAIQIIAAVSGTLGNLRFGSIDLALAVPVTVGELAGVVLGARLAHAVEAAVLQRFVAVVCIAVGALVMLSVVDR